jgi:sphingomyelin phosphodiesterase
VGSPANCYSINSGLGCCNKYLLAKKPYRSANKWGDYNCDAPLLLIDQSLMWIKKNIPDLDFIIYTGDSANHHDFSQSISSNMLSIETIHKLFSINFPSIKVFPNIGNHDTYPIDQTPPFIDSMFRKSFVQNWKYWLSDNELTTVAKGGYYWTKLSSNMNIISLKKRLGRSVAVV